MPKAKKKKAAFPAVLYVVEDQSLPRLDTGDEPIYAASPSHDGAGDGEVVAIYALKGTRIKRVVHALEDDDE